MKPVGVASATFVLGLIVVGATAGPLSGFTITHHLFRYQDGFLRRSLVGSIIGVLTGGGPVQEGLPRALGLGFLAALLLVAAVLIGVAVRRGDPVAAVLLAALLVGSSELRILAFDIGKFDGLLLALTASVAVASLGHRRPAIAFGILLSVVGVLIHELHLIAGVPLAAAFVALRHGEARRDRLRIAATVAGPASVLGAGLALTSGRMPGGSQAAAEALLEARAAFPVSVSSTYVQGLSLLDSVALTFEWVGNNRSAVLATVLTALPGAIAALLLLSPRDPLGDGTGRSRKRGLVVAALSPLLLLAVGFDWYRWLTILTVNLILAGLWVQAGARSDSDPTGASSSHVAGPGLLAVGAVLASLVLAAVSPRAGLTELVGILS